MEFLYGIGTGVVISLCFSFGPAFFNLLQISVQHGFRKALPFVFGVSFDDILIVGALLTVLYDVDMEHVMHLPAVATVGGLALVCFGLFTFLHKVGEGHQEHTRVRFQPKGDSRPINYYLRGFFINFFNPLIWLYWLSIVSLASGRFGLEGRNLFVFFAGVLCTTLTLDVAKCKGASLLHRVLTVRHIMLFNKMIGVLLMGFGIYIFVSVVFA